MKEKHATECTPYDIINSVNAFEDGRRNSDLVNLCLAAIKEHNSKSVPITGQAALEWFSDLAQEWCDNHNTTADRPGHRYIHSSEGMYTIEYCAYHYVGFSPSTCDKYMLDMYYTMK